MYLGNFLLNSTIDFKFTSRQFSTGAPFTIAAPTVSIYTANSTIESTTGVTVTTNFDSVVGLNHVRLVATSTNGYTTGTDLMAVITAGTVDSVSVVGEVLRELSIENRVVSLATSTVMNSMADSLILRNIATGGSSGARTVQSALRRLRNKVILDAATGTIFQEDDTTPAWEAAITTAAGNPVTTVEPTT